MTSKERVQTAFAHKHPDKVPVDFGGMNCSMINAVVLNELRIITDWNTVLPRSMICLP